MIFTTIILAAGKGTRMKSELPKVLHPLCGKAMIHYPVDAAREAGSEKIVTVIGHGADSVKEKLALKDMAFVVQEEQLGTGHAVMVCKDSVQDKSIPVVILCGDAPLIQSTTITGLVKSHLDNKNSVTVLTADMENPQGYGRIIKDGSEILRIVEEKDASHEEKCICEINSGVYCVDGEFLFKTLESVGKDNAQGEYYLTDIIKIGSEAGKKVGWSKITDSSETMGINSRKELAEAGAIMRRRITDDLMAAGVTIIDPECTYIDGTVQVGRDSTIYPQVRLEGKTLVGENCAIESGAVIKDSHVGNDTHIKPYCVITDSRLGEKTAIGPFAHIRPASIISEGGKVGNFVEIKKATIGKGSKVNHLTYVGDADVGQGVNIGAGTITCNYDGYRKFKTVIEDGAFIGSGTNLVAPVTIGKGSVIGAGSTITKTVPPASLSLTRPEQRCIKGWPEKRRKERGE
ncbi:MAG: bifunctional UDP-N-acetylglucosamine diphosphorylase/glucosamine-1-phosphate N-acetyltransferase GlmU [Deltaproteobacteria bacterium]|nr:bifunctional UDP-N-acetylglucosamine diphosphorylase/glucosamine-1-phosphate N-acetyltransferase GlmU [Deltaproteobacteria bacterium]